MTRAFPLRSLLILAAFLVVGQQAADAQVRRGRALDTRPRWAPISVGARFGWDQAANGETAGVQVRIPLVRNGTFEFVPSADLIFPNRPRETQYNLELMYVPGGTRGGVFLGGGLGWRETTFGASGPGVPATRRSGYTLAIGGTTNLGPIIVEATLRWAFLKDITYRPNPATLGISVPLWRAGPGD